MVRKILLPALAIAMLGGCVTSGYQYRSGYGDYYYGQPQVQYRYYGAPYGSVGYGYPYGWSGSFGYRSGFGSPYGYYGGYYDPYRYYYPRRADGEHGRDHHDGNDGNDNNHGSDPRPGHRDDRDRPPLWRDLGHTGRPGVTAPVQPQRPIISALPSRPPAARSRELPSNAGNSPSRQEPKRDVRRKRES